MSAPGTDRLYPQEIPLVFISVRGCQPQGHSADRRIKRMKNPNDTIGNRTCDLPACVSQCLNQLRHRVPIIIITMTIIIPITKQQHIFGIPHILWKALICTVHTKHFSWEIPLRVPYTVTTEYLRHSVP